MKGTTPWKIQDVSYFLPHPLWFQVRGDGHSLPFTDASFDTVVGRVWLKLVDSVQSGVIFDGRLPILGLVWEESLNMTTWGLPKSCNRWKIYVICMKGTLLSWKSTVTVFCQDPNHNHLHEQFVHFGQILSHDAGDPCWMNSSTKLNVSWNVPGHNQTMWNWTKRKMTHESDPQIRVWDVQ